MPGPQQKVSKCVELMNKHDWLDSEVRRMNVPCQGPVKKSAIGERLEPGVAAVGAERGQERAGERERGSRDMGAIHCIQDYVPLTPKGNSILFSLSSFKFKFY